MSPSIKTKNLQYTVSAITGMLLLLSTTAISAETQTASQNLSISYASSNAGNIDITTQLKLAKPNRSTAFVKQGYRSETASSEKYQAEASYSSSIDFSIYNVTTELLSDLDYDGFYHHFSITVDADTIFSNAYVYAKLYLSYEGGPWNYYASSASYPIYADSSFDTFVIDTVLENGYDTGYYDIRIELYDAEFNTRVVSYGPYDDYSINALPLEDNFRDDGYDNYHPVADTLIIGSGTIGSGIWLILLSLLIARTIQTRVITARVKLAT